MVFTWAYSQVVRPGDPGCLLCGANRVASIDTSLVLSQEPSCYPRRSQNNIACVKEAVDGPQNNIARVKEAVDGPHGCKAHG